MSGEAQLVPPDPIRLDLRVVVGVAVFLVVVVGAADGGRSAMPVGAMDGAGAALVGATVRRGVRDRVTSGLAVTSTTAAGAGAPTAAAGGAAFISSGASPDLSVDAHAEVAATTTTATTPKPAHGNSLRRREGRRTTGTSVVRSSERATDETMRV